MQMKQRETVTQASDLVGVQQKRYHIRATTPLKSATEIDGKQRVSRTPERVPATSVRNIIALPEQKEAVQSMRDVPYPVPPPMPIRFNRQARTDNSPQPKVVNKSKLIAIPNPADFIEKKRDFVFENKEQAKLPLAKPKPVRSLTPTPRIPQNINPPSMQPSESLPLVSKIDTPLTFKKHKIIIRREKFIILGLSGLKKSLHLILYHCKYQGFKALLNADSQFTIFTARIRKRREVKLLSKCFNAMRNLRNVIRKAAQQNYTFVKEQTPTQQQRDASVDKAPIPITKIGEGLLSKKSLSKLQSPVIKRPILGSPSPVGGHLVPVVANGNVQAKTQTSHSDIGESSKIPPKPVAKDELPKYAKQTADPQRLTDLPDDPLTMGIATKFFCRQLKV